MSTRACTKHAQHAEAYAHCVHTVHSVQDSGHAWQLRFVKSSGCCAVCRLELEFEALQPHVLPHCCRKVRNKHLASSLLPLESRHMFDVGIIQLAALESARSCSRINKGGKHMEPWSSNCQRLEPTTKVKDLLDDLEARSARARSAAAASSACLWKSLICFLVELACKIGKRYEVEPWPKLAREAR